MSNKKPRYKTHLNADLFEKRYAVNRQPSMTIPDQTMSIREIMNRYARGLPLNGQKVPIYLGEDDDMPDIKHMDLAEQQQYLEEARQELQDLKGKINEKRRQQQIAKLKKIANKIPPKDEEKPKEEDPK